MATEKKSVFETLKAVNVNEHTQEKNGLTYLSWAWAWSEIKTAYPTATYTVYERDTEWGPVNYFTDGRTCWVKTGVTIEGQEHIEYLPIMDYRNLSIPVDRVTSMDMNKAIQRSLTKALARHGLGLYIYAGEDLPWTEEEAKAREDAAEKAGYNKKAQKPAPAQEGQPKAKKVADLTEKAYNAWVEFAAMGKNTQDGLPARDGFINKFRPNEKELEDFDKAVFRFQLDNGINPEEGTKQASLNL
jgi:hypothetical protein